MIIYFAPFLISLAFSLILVPIVRQISIKRGFLSQPRGDRWHQKATPSFGGVAIFTAFMLTIAITSLGLRFFQIGGGGLHIQWNMLLGSVIIFALGLYDDIRELTPPAKLVVQILAAAIIIYEGFYTQFFTPRFDNVLVAQILNILLTFVWVIGITNAMNLLDNMDGLAGGIALITALVLSLIFFNIQDIELLVVALTLAGSVSGFLVFNFPPAKIFMGDSGSLFLGFILAILAIARQPQASNVVAILGVPTLLFLIPILDTVMVTVTRVLKGQSPAQGGRDHASHRLIAFGLSPRKVLLVFYIVALLSGLVAARLESIRYWYSLVLVPILIIGIALAVSYLSGVKVVGLGEVKNTSKFSTLINDLTHRRRIFEIILDFFVICITYYLAYLTFNNLTMNPVVLDQYLDTLPVVLFAVFLTYYIFGIYRGVWKFISLDDLVWYIFAVISGVAVSGLLLFWLNPGDGFPISLYIFFALFLYIGLAGSRSSFKVMRMISERQKIRELEGIFILGASDQGEFALRWIQQNQDLNFRPVGFIDTDPSLRGRRIHGLPVHTDIAKLDIILLRNKVSGIIVIPGALIEIADQEMILKICLKNDCWVKYFQVQLLEGV